MATNSVEAFTSIKPKFVTKPLPPPATTVDHLDRSNDGPSWGLIIPIIMIGVFLTCVAVCLWWHKWRDKRTLHIHRDSRSSFHRSYRGSRSNRSGFDAVRDSTRSTTPLRSSGNEKIARGNNNIVKVKNVNVIPVQQRPGKYAYNWEKNQWKSTPTPNTFSSSGRLGTKPLSPINEIESPSSMKLSELSRNYDISAQASFSPYHLTWYSSANPPPPYERSGSHSRSSQSKRYPPLSRRSGVEHTASQNNAYEPEVSSPFFPNNNTPTTECDTGSENSQAYHDDHRQSYQYSSYPSSPKSSLPSISNTHLTVSTETETNQTFGSHPEASFQTCTTSYNQSHSGFQISTNQSTQNNTTEQTSTNLSSLPSSIAQFSKQNLLIDDNNNSMVVPNAYLTYPMAKILNYTLASSVTSSDTHASENTSLLPNIGSNNTSSYPGATASNRTYPHSTAPTSPEDLSKLVDEMSSIRPVEESSMRPNSSVEPSSRIVSISGNSVLTDLQSSWSVLGEMERSSMTSTNTESQPSLQNGSLYWDNYPWAHGGTKAYPELPLQMHDSFVQQARQSRYQRPVLMETQYWV